MLLTNSTLNPYFISADDILLCIPKNMIDTTVNIFNSYDQNLQFTIELPLNNSISFLDIKLIVNEQRYIVTNWYQKKTFSGRYLNYFSHHTQCNKIAIIYSLVDRAIKLSHCSFHKKNLTFIKDLLLQNNYPLNLIEFSNKKRLKKLSNIQNSPHNNNNNKKMFISLRYVKEMEKFINHLFKQHNTNVIYSINNKLNNIIKLGKDKTKISDNVNVVYKINCKNCDASYVGQSGRRLDVRIKEHTQKYINQDNNSSLYTHATNNNHDIDLTNIKILDTECNRGKRLFIHTQKNYINKQFEITKLHNHYTPLTNNCEFMRS